MSETAADHVKQTIRLEGELFWDSGILYESHARLDFDGEPLAEVIGEATQMRFSGTSKVRITIELLSDPEISL